MSKKKPCPQHEVHKNYYLRLDDKERLTLELTDTKDIQECVALTIHCINEVASKYPRLPKYDDKQSRAYFSPNTNPQKAHRNGFNLAIREVRGLFKAVSAPPTTPKEEQ